MFAGALGGALLLKTSIESSLAAAAILAFLTWLAYLPAARRIRPPEPRPA
jgi:hypothetical protein